MAQYVDLMGGGAGSDSDDYIPNNIGSVYGAAQNYGPRNSGGGFRRRCVRSRVAAMR